MPEKGSQQSAASPFYYENTPARGHSKAAPQKAGKERGICQAESPSDIRLPSKYLETF